MDLNKVGRLLCDLRKSKGMTQKQVADRLGIVPKTVSKWETGHGFPDVSIISALADVLGVSEKIILSGCLTKNATEAGNVSRTKFYVCKHCGSVIYGTGQCSVICCGKPIEALVPKEADDAHSFKITEIENDFYIEFNHQMEKEHFISFVSYIGFERVLTVRLYPQQDAAVRIPKMFKGRLYYYCERHGLFVYDLKKQKGYNPKNQI